jgi:uncharacterized spore protein YtfJ
MILNELFDVIDRTRDAAHWRSAFGEPQTVGETTVIPVAQVGHAYGLGFGQGEGSPKTEEAVVPSGEGGGAGGGFSAKPIGMIVVCQDRVYFEETEDSTKIALAGIGIAALFLLQLGITLRAIFGRR